MTTMTLSPLPAIPDPAAPNGPASPGSAGLPGATGAGPAAGEAFQAALAMALRGSMPGVPDPQAAASSPLGNGDPTAANGVPNGHQGRPGQKGLKARLGLKGSQTALAQLTAGVGATTAPLAGVLPVSPLVTPATNLAAAEPATAPTGPAAVSGNQATPAAGSQPPAPGAQTPSPSAVPPAPGGPPSAAGKGSPPPPSPLPAPPPPAAPSASRPPAAQTGDLPAASGTVGAATGRAAPAKPLPQHDDPEAPPTGSVQAHAPASATPNATATAGAAPGPSALARRVMDAVAQVRDAPPPAHIVVDLPELDGLRMRVSLSGSTVHMALMGESPDPAQGRRVGSLIQDVASGLSGTGLQLGDVTTGGRQGSGDLDRQRAAWGQPTPARAPAPRTRGSALRI